MFQSATNQAICSLDQHRISVKTSRVRSKSSREWYQKVEPRRPYVKFMDPKPKSWAELLKQREAERQIRPGPEFYCTTRPKPQVEAGIRCLAPPENPVETPKLDTHLYATTYIFDPEEKKPQITHPTRDHGTDITRWPKRSPEEREDATNAVLAQNRLKGFPKVQLESGDCDIVSGVPHKRPFTAAVEHIQGNRAYASKCSQHRKIDPVSNQFPSAALEAKHLADAQQERRNQVEHFQAKMSENERRAKNTGVNIITGEVKDPKAAKAIREFATNPRRAEIARQREVDIVARREEAARIRTARTGCRFNTGRMNELKDWSIISGDAWRVGWDESVKMRPTVWEWCDAERCDPSE
jgi:hypothetical protein